MVALKGEVPAVYKFHYRLRKVPPESLRASRNKARIILSPNRKQRWLMLAQVSLHFGIEFHIILIVKDEVVLLIHASLPLYAGIVDGITVGADAEFGRAIHILSLYGFESIGRRVLSA